MELIYTLKRQEYKSMLDFRLQKSALINLTKSAYIYIYQITDI